MRNCITGVKATAVNSVLRRKGESNVDKKTYYQGCIKQAREIAYTLDFSNPDKLLATDSDNKEAWAIEIFRMIARPWKYVLDDLKKVEKQ
jgi:hypothetical protein